MPILSSNISKDAAELYTGYDRENVGAGLISPDIYKTPGYSKNKIQKLVIGGLSSIVYSSFEVDPSPLVIPIALESQYNTILAYNLHYVPRRYRQAILKLILDQNAARIRANQPIMIDYYSLKKRIPQTQFIVRRYKQVLIRVVETYPLVEWPEAIKEETRWSNHYRKFQK